MFCLKTQGILIQINRMCCSLTRLPRFTSLPFPFRNESSSRQYQPNTSKQGIRRHKSSHPDWTRQPGRQKRVLRTGKRERDTLLPLVRGPPTHIHTKSTKLNNRSTYVNRSTNVEDLAQTHAGSLIAASESLCLSSTSPA